MMTATMLHTLEVLESLDDVSNTYELADRIGITERVVGKRLRSLKACGFVTVDQPRGGDVVGAVRTTPFGRVARERALDGLPIIPTLHPDIERATLAVLALHAYGTETP